MTLLQSTQASNNAETLIAPGKTVVRFASLSKRFGDVPANDAVSFEIESGGIHAIVGENGAGKSTLSKILCGYYRPDRGAILINDREVSFNSPAEARRAGIGMVHQQLALVQSLTGFENVVLGDGRVPFLFGRSDLERQVTTSARQFGFEFDLKCPVANLSVAERQKLEIFKLLWRDSRILILDEPTSQLSPFEANDVLSISERLAADGRVVILITHHISEVMRFAKHVTMMRKGRCITTVKTADVHSDDLAKMMVDNTLPLPTRISETLDGTTLLRLDSISTKTSEGNRALRDISLQLSAGEIVGIAGISGSGQNELGRLIAGLIEPAAGAIVNMHGQRMKQTSPDLVCYIPSDQRQAYAPGLSVAANSFLRNVDKQSAQSFGFIKKKMMMKHAKQLIDSFQIKPGLPTLPAHVLSGGNLQRLIIGRELETDAKVIVADNPCAGLDIFMSTLVRIELRNAANQGRGVILISPDLEELINTCDRIIVMFNGRINGQQDSANFDYESLALLMGGKASLCPSRGSIA